MTNRIEASRGAAGGNKSIYIIEVQPRRTFDEVGGKKNISLMGIAFVALIDPKSDRMTIYTESEIEACLDALDSAQMIIGYHLDKFVFPLLAGYRAIDRDRYHRLDMLDDVNRKIGRKVEISDLLYGTLEIKRAVDPMKLARQFQQGEIELVKQATAQMARDLAAIYHYGKEKGYVCINGPFGQRWKISIRW